MNEFITEILGTFGHFSKMLLSDVVAIVLSAQFQPCLMSQQMDNTYSCFFCFFWLVFVFVNDKPKRTEGASSGGDGARISLLSGS